MERQAISSTSIRSVGYDPDQKMLEIEFQSGEVYDFHDVPQEVYRDLMQAESHGQFFQQNIREKYPFQHK